MGFDEEAGSSSQALTPPLPREDTPLLGKPRPLSSMPKAFANVFNSILGAGVLGLPYAFKRTGWLTSLLILFSVAALTYRCMMLLVIIRRKLESVHGFSKIASFGDLGFAACGSIGRIVVDIMMVLSQAGFCVSYLIFIGNTVANLLNSGSDRVMGAYLSSTILGISAKSFCIWGSLPFQLGLNSIETLTHLAPVSFFADAVGLGAMGTVVTDAVSIIWKNGVEVQAFRGLSVILYGLGVAVYAFEGTGMVLHLESEMKDQSKFGKILATTMALLALIYGVVGLLGYFAFGENTRDIITANLGKGLISTLVQLGLCVNLFFTFPLMMHPVYEILERRLSGGRYCLWLRWLLVLSVSLTALLVPNFGDFLSLVGSSLCCALAFVLPSLFHLLVCKEEMSWKGWSVDMGVIVLGLVLGISGTWYALGEIFSAKVRL